MSNTENAATAASATNPRKQYEQDLERLEGLTKAYRELKAKARDRWQYAEANARDSRQYDKEAGDVLRQCVDLLKQLAGVEAVNALRAMASLDKRAAALAPPNADLAAAAREGDDWDDNDQVTLAELQEEEPRNEK